MRHLHFATAVLCWLGACSIDSSAEVNPQERAQESVERDATDEEPRQGSSRAATPGADVVQAPMAKPPCEVSELAATYLFDASDARGSVTLTWHAPRASKAVVVLELEGLMPETLIVSAGETSVIAGTRVQDALSHDGQIAGRISVELACGAAAQDDFAFEDPLRRCPIPAEDEIAGHEADFYRCVDLWVEQSSGCGEAGYPLGYGAVYAERFFREARPDVSARGQAWIDATLICLQESLRDAIDLGSSCASVHDLAFATHPDCYVESGVCTLPVADLLIIPRTIKGKDLFSCDGLEQLLATASGCGEVYRQALREAFGPGAASVEEQGPGR